MTKSKMCIVKVFIFTCLSLMVSLDASSSEFRRAGSVIEAYLQTATQSSPIFQIYVDAPYTHQVNSGTCGATFITNDGVFVTALHCIVGCLELRGLDRVRNVVKTNVEEVFDNKNRAQKIRFSSIDVPKAKSLICSVGNINAKILSLGASGFIDGRDIDSKGYLEVAVNWPTRFAQLNKDGFTGMAGDGDFAVLKVDAISNRSNDLRRNSFEPTASEQRNCLQLSAVEKSNRNDLEKILNLAWPNFLRETSVNYVYPMVTMGEIIPFEKSQFATTTLNNANNLGSIGGIQFSNIDGAGGSSGSSYFDVQGNVYGIVVGGIEGATYLDGASYGVRSDRIISHLKKDLGFDFAKSIVEGCKISKMTESMLLEIYKRASE